MVICTRNNATPPYLDNYIHTYRYKSLADERIQYGAAMVSRAINAVVWSVVADRREDSAGG